jgi:hypothetical protein
MKVPQTIPNKSERLGEAERVDENRDTLAEKVSGRNSE